MPITKHSYLVRKAADLPRIIHEAFHIANTGRKGPVLIDIPKDVSAEITLFEPAKEVNIRGYNPTVSPNKQQVDKLLKAIQEAERPLILAGGGVVYSGAHEELHEFVKKSGIPITTTLLGLVLSQAVKNCGLACRACMVLTRPIFRFKMPTY